jgi:hypothetical protein
MNTFTLILYLITITQQPHHRISTTLDSHPHVLDLLGMAPSIPPCEYTYSGIYKGQRFQELG